MNIIDFLKSLLPNFSKNRVVDDARVTYAELEGTVLPSYVESEKFFTNRKFRSKALEDMSVTFKRNVDSDKDANMMVAISRALHRMADNKQTMQDRIESNFESEVVANGLSCVKTNLLRLLSLTTFVSNYALTFLNYAYILETGEETSKAGYVRSSLSPAELQYLQNNFAEFCLAINAIAKDKSRFAKTLDSIPDVLIDINTGQTIMGTIGEDKLDPFLLRNFSGNTNNPIYHLRLIVAGWQIEKWKRDKELKKVLELRLLHLQSLTEGNNDAKLEREIEYTQGRVQALDHRIQQMKESVE